MKEITKEMIALAAKGDQYAMEDLYNLTYNSVSKAAKALIRDEDAVLDVVQDSYVKAFQSLDQLDRPEKFPAWLKQIATNKAKDYLKKKKPLLFSEMAGEDGEEIDFRDETPGHMPEEVLDRKETTRLIDEILGTLTEEQRMAIGLHYYQDLSVKEIAKLMDCSENTVKSRLNYGRKKVETKVRELEKQGTKLYSLAPLAFLRWLFRMDAQNLEIPSSALFRRITAKCAAPAVSAGTAGTARNAAAGAKAAAGTGAKALSVKVIAGILAATIVGGGAITALSSNNREENAPTQPTQITQTHTPTETVQPEETTLPAQQETAVPETTEQTLPAVTAEEAYQEIVQAYQTVLSADKEAFLRDHNSYFNGDHRAVGYYHMYHSHSFHYAYYDIDRNGTDELLFGISFGQTVEPVDLYCFDGEKAVQLIDEPSLSDRSHLVIQENGILYFFGSSSASESSESYLQISGTALEEVSPNFAPEATDIPWMPLEIPQPEETIPENTESTPSVDTSAITGLYETIREGSGMMVSVAQKDETTLIIGFSNAFSNEEPQYEVSYEDGYWKLWVDGYLMYFNFTIREGHLEIAGNAPDELYDYLGMWKKLY